MSAAVLQDNGESWPTDSYERSVTAGGVRWHVQVMGTGPSLLLLHGTGSSTHSWRAIAPLLAARFQVIAPDLPGHGASSSPEFESFSLPRMAHALGTLMQALHLRPAVAVGHSAGAALLVRMVLDRMIAPQLLIGINAALLPLSGVPGWLFAPLARVLARSSTVPRLVSKRAEKPETVRRLLADTGSRLDRGGIALYQALAQRPEHVAAALKMMANWDLRPLARDLPHLKSPLVLLTAEHDRTIPPAQSRQVQALAARARVISLGAYGHLAHEECPVETAALIVRLAIEAGIVTR
jgi:magnesium chelatase accessory protein